MNKYEQTCTNMNKYEQLYEQLYMTKYVYNGVYEGNITVSMIHLYTRGLGTYTRGETHLSLFKSYVNKYSQRAWDLYLHEGPWYFWEDLKKTFIFDLLFKVKKQTDRGMYKKVYVQKGCTMKYLISCTGMGLIPMWRPMFYFIKHG